MEKEKIQEDSIPVPVESLINQEFPAPSPIVEEKKTFKIPKYIWIPVVFLIMASLAILGFFLASGQSLTGGTDLANSEEQEEDDVDSLTDWKGTYLSAVLPDGWNIKELDTVGYVIGFGGFEILKGDTRILIVESIPYIGFGPCDCSTFYAFEDSNPAKFEEVLEFNKTDSNIEICAEDYETTKVLIEDYSEVELLSESFRRSAQLFFIDSTPEDTFFDVGCSFFTITTLVDPKNNNKLNFTYSDYSSLDDRYIVLSDSEEGSMSEKDLLILDFILESIGIEKEVDWELLNSLATEGKTKSYEDMSEYEQEQYVKVLMKDSWETTGLLEDEDVAVTQAFDFYDEDLDDIKFRTVDGYAINYDKYGKASDYDEIVKFWADLGFTTEIVFDGDRIVQTQLKDSSIGCVLTKYNDLKRVETTTNGSLDISLYCSHNIDDYIINTSSVHRFGSYTLDNFIHDSNLTVNSYLSNEITYNEELDFVEFYLTGYGFDFIKETKLTGDEFFREYESELETCKVTKRESVIPLSYEILVEFEQK